MGAASSADFSGYTTTTWRNADGAPADVSSMAQTPDGWIWLGTSSGLYRFDGRAFERYDAAASGGPGTRAVSALTATDDGGVWVAYSHAALVHIDAAGVSSAPQGLDMAGADGVFVDGTGRTFASTGDQYFRLVGGRWQHLASPAWSLPAGVFASAGVDTQGAAIVVTDKGIYRLVPGSTAFTQVAPGTGEDDDLFEDLQQKPWRSNGQAFEPVPGARWRLARGLARNSASTTFVDASGALWAMGGGCRDLCRRPAGLTTGSLPMNGPGVERMPAGPDSLMAMSMMQDTAGNIWVGGKQGINRFSPNLATPIGFSTPSYYFAPVPLPGGQVWVGTDSHGGADDLVEVAENRVVTRVAGPHPVTSAMLDTDGAVLAGGHGTLVRYRNGRLTPEAFPAALDGEIVETLLRDRGRRLWVGVRARGLYAVEHGVWTRNGGLAGLPSSPPSAGASDDGGRTWFGYASGAIATVHGTRVTGVVGDGQSAVGAVAAIVPGSPLLLAGEQGLAWFDGIAFQPVRLRHQDVLSGATGLVRRPNGDIWVNARAGLVRITASEFRRAVANPQLAVAFSIIDEAHGLPGGAQQTRPLPTLVADTGGRLWVAGAYGLAVVDPDASMPPEKVTPSIVGMRASSSNLDPALAHDLDPSQSTLSFAFVGLSLTDARHVEYRYRLLGADERWRMSADSGWVQYAHLGPGHYRFEVQARGPNGDWSTSAFSATVNRRPAFYQAPWFFVLVAMFAAALVGTLYRARVAAIQRRFRERVAERNHERDRIARDLHDSLLQGMQGISLRLQSWQVDDRASTALQKEVQHVAERLNALTLEGRARIVGLRSSGSDTITLADALSMIGDDHAATYAGSFDMTVLGDEATVPAAVRATLIDILGEAIHNAFVHGNPGAVSVTLDHQDGSMVAVVDDDGVGLPPGVIAAGQKPGHWGLANMRERARLAGGTLMVTSDASGTVVTVTIPLQNVQQGRKARSFVARRNRSSPQPPAPGVDGPS
jgi:signal transduction histidine kinase/ligand-binding sensor domain-containing protein